MCVQDIPATNTKPTAFLFPAVTIPRGTQFPAPPVAGRRVPARRSVSFRASNLAIQLVQSGFDRRTTHLLENGSTQVAWGNNVSRAGAAYTVLPVMSGFYLYGVLSDNQKARETGVLGGEALLDGLIVSQLLKVTAGRNRPNAPDQPGDFFKGGASFPSGHSIEAWAMASVVAHEYGNKRFVPVVAYGLAALVSSARFTARQHYASDLVAGGR